MIKSICIIIHIKDDDIDDNDDDDGDDDLIIEDIAMK